MSQPPPGPPPFGHGGYPPPPPYAPPPQRRGSARTLAWLGAGLVLVLMTIGVVALAVRESGSDHKSSADGADGGDKGTSSAHRASCATYYDVVLSPEVWASAKSDPDRVQEIYDSVLADITDDGIARLVTAESEVAVPYYRALAEWKQAAYDALGRGEEPETTVPTEITDQRTDINDAQRAVLEACQDALPDDGGDEPVPSITAPTLERPTWMDDQ